MFERGDRVKVSSRGRETELIVWEDRGRGVVLTSEDGFARAQAGDPDAPLVGFPRRDVAGLAGERSSHIPVGVASKSQSV